jgi:hypothetical protein
MPGAPQSRGRRAVRVRVGRAMVPVLLRYVVQRRRCVCAANKLLVRGEGDHDVKDC